MLTITAAAEDPREAVADLLVVPVFKGGIEGPGASLLLSAVGLDDFPVTPSFRGDIGQSLLLAAPGIAAGGLLLVGLGRMDAVDAERLRRAAGVAAREARGAERVVTTLATVSTGAAVVEAVAEGFLLGAHTDLRFKGREVTPPRLREVVVLVPSASLGEARQATERAAITAGATIAARELVNLPPDRKRPPALAEALVALAGRCCEATVLDERQLAEGGFGGILGVGRGSSAPPRLVELRYRPASPLGHVALVGKGITFDSGGLSLKRGGGMDLMKSDMAGAAAIAAAMSVLDQLDVRLEVTALLALAENLPGADAQRPGDVVVAHGGTTIEVVDTDAEGRLVLADALHHATTFAPDAIVDLATLTGSSITALGTYTAAVMGTDEELLASVRRAADVAGESVWPLPLSTDLDRFIDTPIADVRNLGDDDAGGGAITAALLLKRFVGDTPWVHLDIAGPAFLPADLAHCYTPPGGTGFGVRTLLAWLQRRG